MESPVQSTNAKRDDCHPSTERHSLTRKLMSCTLQYSRKARKTSGQYSFTLKWLGITSLRRNVSFEIRRSDRRDVLVEILIVNSNLDVSFEMFRKKHHGDVDILQFVDLKGSIESDACLSSDWPWNSLPTWTRRGGDHWPETTCVSDDGLWIWISSWSCVLPSAGWQWVVF